MYLIDGRGQGCLKALGHGLLEELQQSSVAMAETRIGALTPAGLKTRVNPMKDATRNSYWLPRHVFVRLLLSAAEREPRIRLVAGASLEALRREPSGLFSAHGASGDSSFEVHGKLLVGADGIRSAVRAQLEEWDGGRGSFVPREFDSPAAGLRYKVLTLPSDFSVDVPNGTEELKSEVMYSVRGAAAKGPKLRMGMIPVRSIFGSRTANVITKPDDAFWDVEDVDGLLAYAARQWPHFPIESFVPREELERFAADRGGRFPKPQHSPSAAWAAASAEGQAEEAGAVILGDALHAFPPDIGQGVNSALEDVMVLAHSLDTQGDGRPAAAVKSFEEARMPDAEALVQMVRVSAPFQYSQDPFRAKLWSLSFLGRLLLNKAMPSIFDLPSFMLVQRAELSYSEVWSRGRRGARRAGLLLGSAALAGAGLLVRLVA